MTSSSASMMSTAEVNESVWIILGSVIGLAALGVAADMAIRRFGRKRAECPRMWALALLLGSYGCLAPGLVLNLFDASTVLSIFGQDMVLTAWDESMLELIARMFRQGMYTGAILVILFALVIPVVKVLLLVLGICFQMGQRPQLRRARQCIMVVRAISKWASPDMFAYILIANLFRSIDHPPKLNSTADLGAGFTCFCVFCAVSTIGTLGLPVPELPEGDSGEKAASTTTATPTTTELAPTEAEAVDMEAVPSPRVVHRPAMATARELLSLLLATAFGLLLGYGLVLPCMSLHMEMDLLYSARPQLKQFASVIDTLNLPSLLKSEVSVLSCLTHLSQWVGEGYTNGAVAFAMYGIFGLLLPVLDVVALLVCALSGGTCSAAFRASSVLGKLAMLDVAVVGVVVTVLSLRNFQQAGAVVALGPGMAPLAAAEACHYALALVVPKPSAARATVPCRGDDGSTTTPSETPSESSGISNM